MNKHEDRILNQIEARDTPWQRRDSVTVKIVWCLRCVARVQWVPTQDSHRHGCGDPLSLYGPFEERPSFFRMPKPLQPVWWVGNKPAETT